MISTLPTNDSIDSCFLPCLPDGPIITISDDGGSVSTGGARADLRAALEGLGYAADEIHGVLSGLPADGDTTELLKEALRRLASGV